MTYSSQLKQVVSLKTIKDIVLDVKVRNPYPDDIFTEPKKTDWRKISKLLKDNGYSPDAVFGSWGRKVWENCIGDIEGQIDEVKPNSSHD